MAAEIVMVVKNQNPRTGIRFTKKVSRRESAYPAAHHNQIELLASVGWSSSFLPEISVSNAVSNFERSRVAAAQAGQCRRVIFRRFFRVKIMLQRRQQMRWQHRKPRGDCNPIQEV